MSVLSEKPFLQYCFRKELLLLFLQGTFFLKIVVESVFKSVLKQGILLLHCIPSWYKTRGFCHVYLLIFILKVGGFCQESFNFNFNYSKYFVLKLFKNKKVASRSCQYLYF